MMHKRWLSLALTACVGVIFQSHAFADPAALRVLVVFTPDAQDAIVNNSSGVHDVDDNSPVEYSANRIEEINETLRNSGLDDLVVAESAGEFMMDDYDENNLDDPFEVGDSSSVFGNPDVMHDVVAGNVTYDGGKSLDDLRIQTQADAVIVVTSPQAALSLPVPNPQGVAQGFPTTTAGDPNIWIIVDSEYATAGNWPHELGHIAGVAHPDDSTTAVPRPLDGRGFEGDDSIGRIGDVMMDGLSCDDYLNTPGNENKTCETAMQYGDKDVDYIDSNGQNRGKLGDSTHDATATLEQTLPAIAGYAEEITPPASNPDIVDTLLTCVGNSTNYALSFYAGDPIIPVTNYSVERWWGGSWDPWYDGGSSCIFTQVGPFGVYFRVRAENAAGDSDWVIVELPSECGA